MNDDIRIDLERLTEVPDLSTIDRRAIRRYIDQPLKVDIGTRLVPDSRNHLTLVLSLALSYTEPIGTSATLLIEGVAATFTISDFDRHVIVHQDNVCVDRSLMLLMLGVTVGAIRGMIALRVADTPLAQIPIPILDLNILADRIDSAQCLPRDAV
jgi:hypothetical protein